MIKRLMPFAAALYRGNKIDFDIVSLIQYRTGRLVDNWDVEHYKLGYELTQVLERHDLK